MFNVCVWLVELQEVKIYIRWWSDIFRIYIYNIYLHLYIHMNILGIFQLFKLFCPFTFILTFNRFEHFFQLQRCSQISIEDSKVLLQHFMRSVLIHSLKFFNFLFNINFSSLFFVISIFKQCSAKIAFIIEFYF